MYSIEIKKLVTLCRTQLNDDRAVEKRINLAKVDNVMRIEKG